MNTIPISVTIFPGQALITRRGTTHLQAGNQTIRIENLPLNLVTESIRVTGKADVAVQLLGVRSEEQFFEQTPAEAARRLETLIEKLQDKIASQQQQDGILNKELDYLNRLGSESATFARGIMLRARTLEEQAAVFDFVRARMLTIQTELGKSQRIVRQSERELKQRQAELRQLQAQRPTRRNVVLVEVNASAACELQLDLKYLQHGANWQPLYDIRYSPTDLQLSYLAEVSQNSGEDWQGVQLILSTVNLASGASYIPELQPWMIDFAAPPPPRVQPMPKTMRRHAMLEEQDIAAAMPMMTSGAEPAMEMATASAEVIESGLSMSYQLPERYNIPGSDQPRKVAIGDVQVQSELDFVSAPSQLPSVVRRLQIENTSNLTLLPGQAQLFANDEFLGTTHLDLIVPRQRFAVALGNDDRIKLERKLTQRKVDKQILSNKRRIQYSYSIEIENLHPGAQNLLLREQIPLSANEQIKSSLISAKPEATSQSELNLLEWKLTLQAGEKRTVQYSFAVEYPTDKEVLGLP